MSKLTINYFLGLSFIMSSLIGEHSALTLKDTLNALNKARTNPAYFATFINQQYNMQIAYLQGIPYRVKWNLEFNEPAPAVFNTAITFLNSVAALGTVEIDLGMSYAAYKQAAYCGSVYNGITHTGANGNSFMDRIQEYSTSTIFGGGEIILTDGPYSLTMKTAEHFISDFIIDDGVPSRGHRDIIYSGAYSKVGIGIYVSQSKEIYLVIDFASGYTCDLCDKITCTMQLQSGWTQYLKDAQLSDACSISNSSNTSNSSNNSNPSNSSNNSNNSNISNSSNNSNNSNISNSSNNSNNSNISNSSNKSNSSNISNSSNNSNTSNSSNSSNHSNSSNSSNHSNSSNTSNDSKNTSGNTNNSSSNTSNSSSTNKSNSSNNSSKNHSDNSSASTSSNNSSNGSNISTSNTSAITPSTQNSTNSTASLAWMLNSLPLIYQLAIISAASLLLR